MIQKSRTLIIAIPVMVILVSLVIYQYGYIRISTGLAEISEERDLKLDLLNKYNSLISEKPRIEKELALLREERQADNAKLIEASSLSIASATLQKIVKEIILGSGGTIKSQRVNKMEDYGPFKVITVSIDTEMPDAGVLGDILYSIETSTPYIMVKGLDVRVRKARSCPLVNEMLKLSTIYKNINVINILLSITLVLFVLYGVLPLLNADIEYTMPPLSEGSAEAPDKSKEPSVTKTVFQSDYISISERNLPFSS
jgi:hypothetical protein